MTEFLVPTTSLHGNANQLDMLGSQETTIKVAISKTEDDSGQSEKDILATIKKLVEELQSERLHDKELQKTEDMLTTGRIKDCESKQQMFGKRVKDLEQLVNQLSGLANREVKQTKPRGTHI